MTTTERTADLQNAQLQGSASRDHAWLKNYNFAVEEVTTGAELESQVGSLANGQAVVFLQKDASDASGYVNGYYGISEDGTPKRFLQADLILAGTIANATGSDLQSLTTVEQVKAYVQAENSQAFINVGAISADAANFNGLLPANGSVEPNKTYFGRIAPGVTVDGELYERGGIFYFSSSSNQLADGSVDALEMNDDVTVDDTVTSSSSNAVKSSGIHAFVTGLTSALSASVTSLDTRMSTAEGDILALGTSKLDTTTFTANQGIVSGEQAVQDSRLNAVEAKDTAQDTRLSDLEAKDIALDSDIASLVSQDTTHSSEIAAIQAKDIAQDGRLDSVEAKDGVQDASIAAIETKNGQQDGRLTTIEAKDSAQDGRLDAIEAKDSAQDSSIASLVAKDLVQAGEITAIEAKDVAQDGRLDAIETEQSTQNSDIAGKLTGTKSDFSGDASTKTGAFASVADTDAHIKSLMVNEVSEEIFPLNGLSSGSVTVSAAQLSAVFSSTNKKSARLYHTTKGQYIDGMNGSWSAGALTVKFGGTYTAIADGVLELHIDGFPN